MKSSALKKSSFTLPSSEVSRVGRLRRRLRYKSNTQVIRRALSDLDEKLSRESLREKFHDASRLVRDDYEIENQEMGGDIGDEVESED